jgi:hypothetical protein
MKQFFILVFISVSLLYATTPSSVNVANDYWGYAFLERLETKGLVKSYELRTRPVSRTVFAEMVRQAIEQTQGNVSALSRTEQHLLEQLSGDFFKELHPQITEPGPEKHTVTWKEAQSDLCVDLYGKQSIISNRGQQYETNELISETTLGAILRGSLNNTVGFYLDARNALTRGKDEIQEENFDPSKGSPVVISGSNVFQDRALAYWTWQTSWLRLQLGRDELQWGPGYHCGLSISNNMPATEMIRLSAHFSRFKFSYVHAFLRSSLGSKYLAGHRLDFMVKPGLYLGASETVIYGQRDVEFAYLNPLMPFHIAQHHLGDKDNKTMSLDMTCSLLRNCKAYLEYFIDDMTSSESLTKFYGNKFAFLAGLHWTDPLRIANTDLRFEYSRVEPYVYSHWDSINIYTNYDQIIGHWLGPNADCVFLQAGWQPLRDFRFELFWERQRKGEGFADTRSRPEHGETKQFLGAVVEKKKMIGVKLVEQIRRDLYAAISYTYADTHNLHQQAGRASNDHLARFEFWFNY